MSELVQFDGRVVAVLAPEDLEELEAEIERLRDERDALRMPAELVERATAMTEFTALSTEDWSEHMEVLLLEILAWHEGMKK